MNNTDKITSGVAIKCAFSNAVHKMLEPNIDIKKRDRWRHRDKYELSDEQKIELANKILKLHKESSTELCQFQYERRETRRVHKARVERGYYNKKELETVTQ
jgi:hypothetical protein